MIASAPFLPSSAAAQATLPADQLATVRLMREGRYLPLLGISRAAQDPVLVARAEQWRAYWGDETGALAHAGDGRDPAPDLSGARAEEAVAAVVHASRGRRIVMLNEAHVASRHRMFLVQLARALRREGFTHLAAETLSNMAPLAMKVEALRAGAQVSFDHGTYTADPVFAEAVREALDLGYQLVPYEQRPDQRDGKIGLEGVPAREQAQAENFAAALKRWPGARFLIHVGYGHLNKNRGRPGGPLFAGRLQEITGIEPLTVIQANNGSFGPHAPDNATTQAVLARFRARKPIAVSGADGKALRADLWAADISVFHPSLPDAAGRPGWLAADPMRRRVRVRLPIPVHDDGTLVQAIHAADGEPAVPADQYLLAQGATDANLFLRPGRYRVRLEAETGFTRVGDVRV